MTTYSDDSASKDRLIRDLMDTFQKKDARLLTPFFAEDIEFENYGDKPLRGRDQLVAMWNNVFGSFDKVKFETVNQAVNGDIVLAEQIHGLGVPGRPIAPIRNLAVYEVRDGKIAAWRDYTNAAYARTLL